MEAVQKEVVYGLSCHECHYPSRNYQEDYANNYPIPHLLFSRALPEGANACTTAHVQVLCSTPVQTWSYIVNTLNTGEKYLHTKWQCAIIINIFVYLQIW